MLATSAVKGTRTPMANATVADQVPTSRYSHDSPAIAVAKAAVQRVVLEDVVK